MVQIDCPHQEQAQREIHHNILQRTTFGRSSFWAIYEHRISSSILEVQDLFYLNEWLIWLGSEKTPYIR